MHGKVDVFSLVAAAKRASFFSVNTKFEKKETKRIDVRSVHVEFSIMMLVAL